MNFTPRQYLRVQRNPGHSYQYQPFYSSSNVIRPLRTSKFPGGLSMRVKFLKAKREEICFKHMKMLREMGNHLSKINNEDHKQGEEEVSLLIEMTTKNTIGGLGFFILHIIL